MVVPQGGHSNIFNDGWGGQTPKPYRWTDLDTPKPYHRGELDTPEPYQEDSALDRDRFTLFYK